MTAQGPMPNRRAGLAEAERRGESVEGGPRDPRLTEGLRWVIDVLDTWDAGDPASDRAAAEGLAAALNAPLA